MNQYDRDKNAVRTILMQTHGTTMAEILQRGGEGLDKCVHTLVETGQVQVREEYVPGLDRRANVYRLAPSQYNFQSGLLKFDLNVLDANSLGDLMSLHLLGPEGDVGAYEPLTLHKAADISDLPDDLVDEMKRASAGDGEGKITVYGCNGVTMAKLYDGYLTIAFVIYCPVGRRVIVNNCGRMSGNWKEI